MTDPDEVVGINTMVLRDTQGLGFAIIIFLAGLQQIPDMYYEAAQIDGANPWQIFWRITVPSIAPTIGVVTTTLIVTAVSSSVVAESSTATGASFTASTVIVTVAKSDNSEPSDAL